MVKEGVPNTLIIAAVITTLASIVAILLGLEKKLKKKVEVKKEIEQNLYVNKIAQIKQSEKTVNELLNEISTLSKKLFTEKFGISSNLGYSEISKSLEAQKRPRVSELCKRIEWALYSGEDIDKFEVEKLLQDLERIIIQESQEERRAKDSLKIETVQRDKKSLSGLNRDPFGDSLLIGKFKETSEDSYLDIDDLNTSTIIAGSTGSGKTIAAQVLAEEALLKNKSVIVFDSTSKWTGFMKKCETQDFLKRYEYFGMNKKNATGFRGSIKIIKDPYEVINIKRYIHKNGEITILDTSALDPKSLELFIASSIEQIFQSSLEESKELKSLIFYENTHKLLTRFGGSGEGLVQVDRAARTFKKFGLGLVLISQILKDLTKELSQPVKTEIQLTTRYIGDLKRIQSIYGEEILNQVVHESIGTAMIFSNDSLSNQAPYFVSFRPILHSKFRLTPKEIEWHNTQTRIIEDLEYQIVNLKKLGANISSLTTEISLLKENMKEQEFISVEAGLKTINKKIDLYWESVGKEPIHLLTRKIRKEVISAGIERSRRERAALDGGRHEAEARRIREIIQRRKKFKERRFLEKKEKDKRELEELGAKAKQQFELRRKLEIQKQIMNIKQEKQLENTPAKQEIKKIIPRVLEIPTIIKNKISITPKAVESGPTYERISESELRILEEDIRKLRREIQQYTVHQGVVKEIISKQKKPASAKKHKPR